MNREFLSWQDSQMHALLSAKNEAEFSAALIQAGQALGFEYIAFGMRMPLPLSNPKLLMVNNYSETWQQRYAQEKYLEVDPSVAHGLRSVLPLVWGDQLFGTARPFWEDAHAHGLKVGWAQSTIDAQGAVGMLTLARSAGPLTDAELRESSPRMRWLVQMALEGMIRMEAARRPAEPPIRLTAREIEVLRWTADGKTSGEIGQIMDISERTVNFHINNSLEKLGSNNKTSAVIKAAIMRLL
ncbi:autoinducer binding domain-containing protein [Massilia sp. B-10]|nr:autoinducer binding domain-containing protein [Massilia sp. B-10]